MNIFLRIKRLAALSMTLMGVPVCGQQNSTNPSQTALDETIRVYCEAWNEADLEQRRQLLERVWDPEGTYVDRNSHVKGRDALIQRISQFLRDFPGTRVVPTSHADAHHRTLRFSWRLIRADSKQLMEGFDFGEITTGGKLKKIVAFSGAVKPL